MLKTNIGQLHQHRTIENQQRSIESTTINRKSTFQLIQQRSNLEINILQLHEHHSFETQQLS